MRIRSFAAYLFLTIAVPCLTAADLTVSKVVLYKHGIGFFERSGSVPAGDEAQLQFKATEMDDVLKSLTVEKRGGGAVSAVRYDSSDPLSKRLEVFPFRIGSKVNLADILDQFKGAQVELRLSTGAIRGSIVSSRLSPATDRQAERIELILFMENGELQTVDPTGAAGLRFVDSKLQSQFQDYLQVISRARSLDKRTVTIESSGGASQVAVSYVVPTPIWKSSYRLIFSGGEPLLEGWAIVDNTTGEDWANVRMSLVSGLPVSFISKLYEPRYLTRPVVQLAQDRAWWPTVHGGVIESEEPQLAQRADQKRRGRRMAQNMPMEPASKELAENTSLGFALGDRSYRQNIAAGVGGQFAGTGAGSFERDQMASTVAAAAVGAELGELFEYKIDEPVTIRKGESAMLPFIREQIKARRLLIYDHANGSQHPLNAVELNNSSGTTMDGGAITVYDAGAYAGEALMETIKSGDKRLISYAVDLGTRITAAFGSSNKLQSEFHYRRGIMTLRRALKETKTYTIRNVDSDAKTVIIEHAARPGYDLVDMKAAEKTANAYRFEVSIAAGETAKFPVVEERVYSEQIGITNLTPDQLFSYVSNKQLDEASREKLRQIADLKRQIADGDNQAKRLDQQINEMVQDQNRLRSNISTLRSVTGQQQRVMEYADKLAGQEGQLVTLRDSRTGMLRQTDDQRRELATLIESLNF
jgi:hypothetical protein